MPKPSDHRTITSGKFVKPHAIISRQYGTCSYICYGRPNQKFILIVLGISWVFMFLWQLLELRNVGQIKALDVMCESNNISMFGVKNHVRECLKLIERKFESSVAVIQAYSALVEKRSETKDLSLSELRSEQENIAANLSQGLQTSHHTIPVETLLRLANRYLPRKLPANDKNDSKLIISLLDKSFYREVRKQFYISQEARQRKSTGADGTTPGSRTFEVCSKGALCSTSRAGSADASKTGAGGTGAGGKRAGDAGACSRHRAAPGIREQKSASRGLVAREQRIIDRTEIRRGQSGQLWQVWSVWTVVAATNAPGNINAPPVEFAMDFSWKHYARSFLVPNQPIKLKSAP